MMPSSYSLHNDYATMRCCSIACGKGIAAVRIAAGIIKCLAVHFLGKVFNAPVGETYVIDGERCRNLAGSIRANFHSVNNALISVVIDVTIPDHQLKLPVCN